MGKHYVPQEYLRGFADKIAPQFVWMFDKARREWSRPAIKRAAQERDFYDHETEQRLAEVIERPAHRVLGKLRAREYILPEERSHLALYIATMITRGPRGRRRAGEIVSAPGVVDDVVSGALGKMHSMASQNEWVFDAETLQALEEMASRYRSMTSEELGRLAHEPWAGTKALQAIERMTWRVVLNSGPSMFLTTDTPAVFFEDLGLGHDHAELTFPLASDMALLASWQGAGGEAIAVLNPTPKVVKEVNRRVAAGAERFLFYHRKQRWIETLALRQKPYFSRIVWRDEVAQPPRALVSDDGDDADD